MNKFLKPIYLFALFFAFAIIAVKPTSVFAQAIPTLTGLYKIGPNEVPPNFKTITAAAIAVSNSKVLGKVIFEIKPGIYTERPIFFPFIGASEKNQVTFRSENKDPNSVTVRWTSDNKAYSHHVIKFQGAVFTTLEAITVVNLNTLPAGYASDIHLTRNSRNNTIKNCILKVDSNVTTANYAAIVSTDERIFLGKDTNASTTIITGNQIIGGYWGVKLLGFSTIYRDNKNQIIGNTFRGQYNAAIYIDNNDIAAISNNDVRLRVASSSLRYGIYLNYCNGNFSINNNKLVNCGAFGISLNNIKGGSRALIFNNTIYGKFNQNANQLAFGINLQNTQNVKIYFNSINFNGGDFNNSGFLFNSALSITSTPLTQIPSSKNFVKNNILNSTNGAYALYYGAAPVVDSSNYNNYFVTGGTKFVFNGAARANLAALKASGTREKQSVSVNPSFVSSTDLHLTNDNLVRKGDYIPLVLTDFEKTPRDREFPDIGADEFIRDSTDLEVFRFPNNYVPRVGSNLLRVLLKNDGLNPINNRIVSLAYSINGGVFTPYRQVALTSLASPYSTQEVVFNADPWIVPSAGAYFVCVKINPLERINEDSYTANEIFCDSLKVGLGGVYTIGGVAPDFVNVISAVSILNNVGIGAPVTFNIRPGTYTGQVTINKIKGSSAVNTVTFKSEFNNAGATIITAAGSGANFHTIRLNAAENIIFKDLSVINTSTTIGSAIHLTNKTQNILISDCNITVNDLTALNEKIIGIVASGATITPFFLNVPGENANNITIRNNTIRGGYAGIQITGNTINQKTKGFIIENNNIDSSFFFGINTQFNNSRAINKNRITLKSNSSVSSVGINISYLIDSASISGNYIRNAGLYGINLTNAEGLGKSILVSNNMIAGGFKTQIAPASGAGIYFIDVNKVDLYSNSIVFNQPIGAAFFIATAANLNSKNNIFSSVGGAYAFYNNSPDAIVNGDNNNFFNNAAIPLAFFKGNKSNLASLQFETKQEAKSISIDPLFASNIDLHTLNPGLDSKGDTLNTVLVDYDGEKRNPRNPDIGADEFILNAIDLDIIDIKPVVFNLGNNVISTEIANSGFNNLNGSTVSLSYQVNSGVWSTPETFTANNLNLSYNTQKFNFTNQFNAGNSVNTNYSICVRINPPGLAGDAVASNNQLCKDICVGLAPGTYSVGPGKTYSTIAAAAAAISCGVAGPVTFEIESGTYNEKVSVGNLKNTSVVNKVIFKSKTNNASDVIITSGNNLTATDFYTFQLNGASFITLDRLTINNTANGFIESGAGVHFTNNAKKNTISNCVINVNGIDSISSNFVGIASSKDNEINLEGNSASENLIENNTINGGYAGIRLFGKSAFERDKGNVIRNNQILNSFNNAVLTKFVDLKEVSNNTMILRGNNGTSVGLSLNNSKGDTKISKNTINKAGIIGLNIDNVLGSDGVEISNNMIGGGFLATESGSAVNIFESNRIAMTYNSFSFDGKDQANGASLILSGPNNRNITLLNNIISNQDTGFAIINESIVDTAIIVADNNNFYSDGGRIAKTLANIYGDLASYQEFTKLDTNSISVDPEFFGPTNLHTSSEELDKAARPLSNFTTDIDGENRDLTFPDIGADEYTAVGNLSLDSIISPILNSLVNDSVDVSVVISNIGNSRISDFPLIYSTNGTDSVFGFYDRILLPGESDVFTFPFKYIPPTTGNYLLCVDGKFEDDIDFTNNKVCTNFTSTIDDRVDGAIIDLVSPASTFLDVNRKYPVKVTIKNVGFKNITNFEVSYKITTISGGVPSTFVRAENPVGITIVKGNLYEHTFADSIFACQRLQVLDVKIVIPSDTNQTNDELKPGFQIAPGVGNKLCLTSVGINDIIQSIGYFNVYPNPTNGLISVDVSLLESSDTKIEILDLLGKSLISVEKFVPVNQIVTIPLDLSGLSNGMYFIRISDKQSSEMKRISLSIN